MLFGSRRSLNDSYLRGQAPNRTFAYRPVQGDKLPGGSAPIQAVLLEKSRAYERSVRLWLGLGHCSHS